MINERRMTKMYYIFTKTTAYEFKNKEDAETFANIHNTEVYSK